MGKLGEAVRMRCWRLALVGIMIGLGLSSVPTAQADPTPPHLYRPLAGMGSDLGQPIYTALAGRILDDANSPVLASYDSLGSATVTTKDPAVAPQCKDLVRANGSSAGRNALLRSLLADDGCLQFARSIAARGSFTSTPSLTWIPLAMDAMTFVARAGGTVSRNLTKAQVVAIYKCQVPSITPELPRPGSGVRDRWLDYVGISRAFDPGQYPCLVPQVDGGTGKPPRAENDARGLSASSIFPVLVSSHLRQSLRLEQDLRDQTVLGAIDGVSPVQVTTDRASDLSFAVHQDGLLNPQLSLPEVREIFRCEAPLWLEFTPVLPEVGSVTRTNWLNLMGITEVMIASGAYPCLQPATAGGVGAPYVREHDASSLERNQVMPFSAAAYWAQAQGHAPDTRGSAVLGVLEGKAPVFANNAFGASWEYFTIVPSAKTTDFSSLENAVFVGPRSRVCTQVDLIRLYGLAVHPKCGDTSSRSSVTPPSAPIDLHATAGDRSISASWAPPVDDGGAPVTSYMIEISRPGRVILVPSSGPENVIPDLVNGVTYSVRVAAVNSSGTGVWSRPLGGLTPRTTPKSPTGLAADLRDQEFTLTWVPPDDNGGAEITSYTVELTGHTTTRTLHTTVNSATFTDLVNGSSYAVRVSAVNSAGSGAWSPTLPGLIPRTIPGAPLSLAVAAGNRSASLTWWAPLDDGGAPVTGYAIEVTDGSGILRRDSLVPSISITGLVNERSHAVRVAAINVAGQGAWSPTLEFLPRAPRVTQPREVSIEARRGQARISWKAPAIGEPLKYVVLVSIDGQSFRDAGSTTSRTLVLPARGRESMRVRVAAIDTRGRGPWSQTFTLTH